MKSKIASSIIYSAAAIATSLWLLTHFGGSGSWALSFLAWLFIAGGVLLFAFCYSSFLFPASAPRTRTVIALVLHTTGVIGSTYAFSQLADFRQNPLRDNDSISLIVAFLALTVAFFVAAVALLFRKKSTLAWLLSFLLWPYWLLIALISADRWFQQSQLDTAFYFLCFAAPLFFAFAAGATFYKPAAAHTAALLGLAGFPWIRSVAADRGMGNLWLVFNMPPNEMGTQEMIQSAGLAILAIGLGTLAVLTAFWRLLPARWAFRNSPLRERTWPVFIASTILIGLWFAHSVMPYRIPGVVDRSSQPILQIAHIEKHGLQVVETAITVQDRGDYSVSRNNRRLLAYRFKQDFNLGYLAQPAFEQIRALARTQDKNKPAEENIKPVRDWQADNWYVHTHNGGFKTYETLRGQAPPRELIELFHDLEKMPNSNAYHRELRDICLGFCYDPLSAMGYIYANERCYFDGHKTVCR